MSDYEDLVELGFEGVDRFATKYHDAIADKVGKTRVFGGKGRKGKEDDGRPRAQSEGVRDGGGDESIGSGPPSHRYKRDEPLVPPGDHLRGSHTPPQGPGQRPEQQRQYPPFVPIAQPGADPLVPWREQLLPPPPPMGLQVPHYDYPRAPDPSSQYHSPSQRHRAQSGPGDYSSDSDSIVSSEKGHRRMYDPYSTVGRTAAGWRDDVRRGRRADNVYRRDMGDYGGRYTPDEHRVSFRGYEDRDDRRRDCSRDSDFEERIVEERAYYRTMTPERGAVVRRDAAWTGAVGSRGPDADRYANQAAMGAAYGQGRPQTYRRGSSWSPSRRRSEEDWRSSGRRQAQSRSPDSYRTVGTIVGALAGGLAGSQVKKGEPVPNALAAVAGAIVGGLSAREAEKAIDRKRARRRREEAWLDEEREERRGRRRSDREQDYERRWD